MKSRLFSSFLFSSALFAASSADAAVLFTETMGTVGGTTAIATHETNNGFDNDAFTMADGAAANPADVRNTNASTGYTGASGFANIFFTAATQRGFSIADIPTTGFENLELSFGYRKESASANTTFQVEFSTNGLAGPWIAINHTATLPAANAPTGWYLLGPLAVPAGANDQANLTIRWVKTDTSNSMRIDDVVLSGLALGANVPPALTNRIQLPAQPTSSTPLSFSVDASDTDGTIASVTLFYLVEPAATPSGVFTSAAMSLSAGNTYTVAPAALASVATGNNVFYYFEATDDDADTTQLGSAASPFSVYVNDSRPAAGAFVINEICHTQAAPQPSATDWIEFHNPTATAIDVSYFTFIDSNPGNPRFTFPFGTIIPADGFIVTAQQGGGFTSFSPWNAVTPVGFFNFGLGGSGDSVIVSDDAGVEYDRVDYTNAAPWPLGNLGTSIELTNPLVDNNDGANWTGGPVNGTPGAQNSTVSVSDWFLLVD
jgi:hypothetical protein